MAYTLRSWSITGYAVRPGDTPYAQVSLRGREFVLLRGYVNHAETVTVPVPHGLPTDDKANKELVKLAMQLSPNVWSGWVP
jgi:hypothetical protein